MFLSYCFVHLTSIYSSSEALVKTLAQIIYFIINKCQLLFWKFFCFIILLAKRVVMFRADNNTYLGGKKIVDLHRATHVFSLVKNLNV